MFYMETITIAVAITKRLRDIGMVKVAQRTGAGQPVATVIYNYSI